MSQLTSTVPTHQQCSYSPTMLLLTNNVPTHQRCPNLPLMSLLTSDAPTHLRRPYSPAPPHTRFNPNGKTWTFVIHFCRPGKFLKYAQKMGKSWNFKSKPKQKLKLVNSMFQDSLLKMSFTEIIHLHLCRIYIINTNTVIQSEINLGFHSFYLDIA